VPASRDGTFCGSALSESAALPWPISCARERTASPRLLATLYRVLGINPQTTIPDLAGRPRYLLDDREPIVELL
jgi:hypothetical protein